jgi:hypothetical protein
MGIDHPLPSSSVMNKGKKDEGARGAMKDEKKRRKFEKNAKETNNMRVGRGEPKGRSTKLRDGRGTREGEEEVIEDKV